MFTSKVSARSANPKQATTAGSRASLVLLWATLLLCCGVSTQEPHGHLQATVQPAAALLMMSIMHQLRPSPTMASILALQATTTKTSAALITSGYDCLKQGNPYKSISMRCSARTGSNQEIGADFVHMPTMPHLDHSLTGIPTRFMKMLTL